jgi:cation diffusion facilitator family transporter
MSARIPSSPAKDEQGARPSRSTDARLGAGAIARRRAVMQVLLATLAANYVIAAAKLAYGWHSGALAFTADGVHALLDGTSNVVGLIGMRVASAPADEGHPYGHQRFEAIAALAIGALILMGLYEIALRAIAALGGASTGAPGWDGIALAAGAFAINAIIARYESRRARVLKSAVLSADAGHTATDALGTLVLIAGSIAARYGVRRADAIAAIIIAVLIARTAWTVLRDNVGVLADARRIDPDVIRRIARDVDGVRGAHKVRSRGSLEHVAVDLHIQVDPSMTVEEAHLLTHRVADRIRSELAEVRDVIIHTEPADGRETKL